MFLSQPLELAGQAILFAALTCVASPAEELPAAPEPHYIPVPATRPNDPASIAHRKWSGIVEPGETAPRLNTHDKLLLPFHETLRWTTPVTLLYSGWYGILRDNDPHFGINAAGFGERVGAAALRQESTRVFGDGLLPILLHEDPRYYRKAFGSYSSRGTYAISRIVVGKHDNGSEGFNYSKILGRGISAALTQTYYPDSSIAPNVVFKSWGISVSQLAGIELYNEFWPDVKRRLFHKSQ